MNPDATRLPTVYEAGMFYVAKVGLGTFPGRQQTFMNYYLAIDSGSDQTWLQCEGAVIAFAQDMPLYPWNLSTTFHPVPCNTPECPQGHCNDGGQCIYIASYASGSATSGVVAKETFTLDSNTDVVENIDLHVGCGLRQDNFDRLFGDNHSRGKHNMIAGILGLGEGPWSFLNQLGAAGQGKFSYCLETFNQNIKASNTYLRFGEDATIGAAARNVHATPIVVREQFRTTYYYLNLKDVSVGDKTVGFPKGTFKLNDQGEGGALIDSGARLSFMYRDHFDRVVDLVKAHISNLGVDYVGPRNYFAANFDACFRGSFDSFNYPPITLHFEQADYVISDHRANFIRLTADTVCLGFLPINTNKPAFVLGAMQQTNKRIVYDTMVNALYFGDENCTSNS